MLCSSAVLSVTTVSFLVHFYGGFLFLGGGGEGGGERVGRVPWKLVGWKVEAEEGWWRVSPMT